MTFLLGVLTGLAMGIAFILFSMWHAKRYPLIEDDADEQQILAAETIIHCPEAYGLRVVKS